MNGNPYIALQGELWDVSIWKKNAVVGKLGWSVFDNLPNADNQLYLELYGVTVPIKQLDLMQCLYAMHLFCSTDYIDVLAQNCGNSSANTILC